MHWLFAILSARSHAFGQLVKGEERVLVWNGEVRRASRPCVSSSD
jgi:hypothetical protein